MAAKKKKVPKKTAKKAKRPAKPAQRKAAPKKTAAKKKSLLSKAIGSVKRLLKTKKKPANRETGEGNYKATKRFRDKEEAFIKKNRSKIPALGKAAEDALAGPEGDELRAAEASTAAHAKG